MIKIYCKIIVLLGLLSHLEFIGVLVKGLCTCPNKDISTSEGGSDDDSVPRGLKIQFYQFRKYAKIPNRMATIDIIMYMKRFPSRFIL